MAKSYSFEELTSEIPAQTAKAPPAEPKEDLGPVGKIFQKAGEAAEAVGPMGVAAGGALKLAGRAPRAVQMMAGPVERGARSLAQALTPSSLRGMGGAVGSAGLAGGAGEIGRQLAESGGAGKAGQQTAEMAASLAPSAASTAVKRATAPLVEAAGKKLYEIPSAIRTPEKEQAIRTAQESGMQILPGQIKESRPLQMVERLMQLLPGSKEEFVKFGRQNQEAANRTVAKAFGGTDPSVASTAMQEAKKNLNKGYEDLLAAKEFKVDTDVASNLSRAFNQNETLREFSLASPKIAAFASSLEAGQNIPANLWKEVRGEISGYVSQLEGPTKTIGKSVLQEFDNIAKKGLGEKDYNALRGLDRQWAALKSFEDAFRRDTTIISGSDVDINKFAKQYANVEPMNVLYGRETGRGGEYVPLSQMSEQYDVFTRPRIPRTEATTLGGLLRAGTGMSLLGGGLAGGVPYLPTAGALTLATPPAARGAARAYLRPEETAQKLRGAEVSPYAAIPSVIQQTKE